MKAAFTKRFNELVSDPVTKEWSIVNLAALFAYIASSVFFCVISYKNGFVAELWIIYLSVCTAHHGVNKYLSTQRAKHGIVIGDTANDGATTKAS